MSDKENDKTQEQEETTPKVTTKHTCSVSSNAPYIQKGNEFDIDESVLCLPTTDRDEYNEVLKTKSNLELSATPETIDWGKAVALSDATFALDGFFRTALERPGSTWTQTPTHEDKKISISVPKAKGSMGSVASGEAAMLRVRAMSGMGTMLNIPLPATGIWIRLKAPTNDRLLMLDSIIANEKYALGRITYGKVFTHNSVYITKHLISCILDHAYDSSLVEHSKENLLRVISQLDYTALVHGFVTLMKPRGYKLAQPCIADITACNHVTTGLVSIPKLLWTDDSRLTEYQRKAMAQRNRKVTNEDVEKYQKERIEFLTATSITIGTRMRVSFRAPTIGETIDTGTEWVDDVVNSMDKAMRLQSEERNAFLFKRGQMQSLCLLSSWIESIDEMDEDNEEVERSIVDHETILSVLRNWSEDSEIKEKVKAGVSAFIADALVSVVGVPDFNCPNCGKEQLEDADIEYKNIIPLNIENIFFARTDQRLRSILETTVL